MFCVQRKPEALSPKTNTQAKPTRRQLLNLIGAMGVGSTVFQRALTAQVEQAQTVTSEMIRQAEWIAGLQLSEEARKTIVQGVQQTLRDCQTLRRVRLDNSVPPAVGFQPAPWQRTHEDRCGTVRLSEPAVP